MILDWVTFGQDINIWQLLLRIFVAVLIGAVIGIEREMRNRPAGMRTHVLVCLGATLVALVEQQMVANVVSLDSSHINVSVGRLTAAVVSGVGFLGAGTIVMTDKKLTGLTTAASLWCTACLGLAIGAGYITLAAIACVVVLIVLKLMQHIIHVNAYKKLEIQFVHRQKTLMFLNDFFEQNRIKVLDTDFHSETRKDGALFTNVYTLSVPAGVSMANLVNTISEHPNIISVFTRNV